MRVSMKNISFRIFKIFLECLPPAAILTLLSPSLILNNSKGYIAPIETWIFLAAVCLWISFLGAVILTLTFIKIDPWIKQFLRSLFILTFLITVFYPEGGRRLDGVAAESLSIYSILILYLIFIAIFAMIFLAYQKFENTIQRIYVTLSLVCFCFIGYVVVNQIRIDLQIVDKNKTIISEKTDLTYAKDQNIIFIIADMLQGSITEQYFIKNPNLKEDFSGFTIFTRGISPFPFTRYSVPAMLTGRVYSGVGNNGYIENMQATYKDSFLYDAQNNGYKSIVIGWDKMKIHPTQVNYNINFSPERLAVTLLELSSTRIGKIDKIFKILRKLTFQRVMATQLLWLTQLKVESAILLSKMSAAPVGNDEKKISLIHNFIPHVPVVFKKDDVTNARTNYIPQKKASPENVMDELEYFFPKVSELLNHLKKIGVYDKSMIIITGDHGHFIGNEKKMYSRYSGASDFKGYQFGNWARSAAMYNPAIFIKPIHNNSPATISHKPISLINLRELINLYIEEKHTKIEVILNKGYQDQLHEIKVFKKNISTSPYQSTKDHYTLKFKGNITNLPDILVKEDQR